MSLFLDETSRWRLEAPPGELAVVSIAPDANAKSAPDATAFSAPNANAKSAPDANALLRLTLSRFVRLTHLRRLWRPPLASSFGVHQVHLSDAECAGSLAVVFACQ